MLSLTEKGLRTWVSALLLVVLFTVLFTVPFVSFGQEFGNGPEPIPEWEITDFWSFLDMLFQLLYTLFFAIAAFFILWAGFLYLTAAGDEEKVGKAKSILVYAIIAVIIAVISLGFAQVVANFVEGGISATP